MVTVRIDTKEIEKAMGNLKSEVPFAVARGMNDTLLSIQKKEVQHISDRFTIRRAAFIKRSVKITQFAKKENLEGSIGIADIAGKNTSDILSKFEKGGTKTPRSGGSIAVPTEHIRPVKTAVVSKGKRPKNLKNSFKVNEGSVNSYIYQRVGRGKNQTIKLAYVLKPSVKIDSRMDFIDTAVHVSNRELQDYLNKRLQEGIAKAGLK